MRWLVLLACLGAACQTAAPARGDKMAIERWVGLSVRDDAVYAQYRAAMAPILAEYGGQFTVDVRVQEVLKAPDDARFDRMFMLRFPDQAAMDSFFSDPRYVKVRAEFFEPSVSSVDMNVVYRVDP